MLCNVVATEGGAGHVNVACILLTHLMRRNAVVAFQQGGVGRIWCMLALLACMLLTYLMLRKVVDASQQRGIGWDGAW